MNAGHPRSVVGSVLVPSGPGRVPGRGSTDLAAAIMRELGRRPPGPDGAAGAAENAVRVTRTTWPDANDREVHPVVVSGPARSRDGLFGAAAVDDDPQAGRILRCAAGRARELGVPLRVVHVWTDRGEAAERPPWCRADHMVTCALYDHLPQEEAGAAEREILHDLAAGPALAALSTSAAVMVVAARGGPSPGGEPLGGTVRSLLGRTACPLAILPAPEEP